ncbi:MAG: HAD superfamily hydrolase (TIGR01549 family) [Candidatus Azotimanducaceae bacterium]|jgi:HAD superfamily hydrolase (TIGR01549 family)
MRSKIKVVAFDLDDTLWHVHPVIVNAEKRLATWLKQHAADFQYDASEMRELRIEVLTKDPSLGYRLTAMRTALIKLSLSRSGYSDQQAASLAGGAMEEFLIARNDVTFFEGALAAIEVLAGTYQLGALSNGNADIKRLGLQQYFSFAFSAEAVGAPKPAPDLFRAALEHTGVSPDQMVYVGDDPEKDVDAANRLGLRTVWLKTEARPGPAETLPHQTIEDIRELPEAISRLTLD